MITELKPYPAMKDSGVPWLGKVPSDWNVTALRALTVVKKGRQPSRLFGPECPAGGVSYQSMNYMRSSRQQPTEFAVPEAGLVIAESGATLLLWDGANAGEFFRARGGVVSSTSALVTPRGIASDYFFYACHIVEPHLRALTVGMGIPHVDGNVLKNLRVPVPSRNEQAVIVRFIDHVDRRIRRYIRAKQKLIKLLEEQKQAIIHRAVTRGLDPNVRLKPSGVEWLGDVPEHWAIRRIKRLARGGRRTFTDGDWIELPYITDNGVRLIQTGNVGRGEYREKGFRYVSEGTFAELGCTAVDPGDVLICRLDGPVGRACVAPDLGCRAITSVDNTILKVSADIDSRFVVYTLSSPVWLDWVQALCRAGGGFRYRVSRSALGDFRIAIPGVLEQRQIADHLDARLVAVRDSIRREIHMIELMLEYRTHLIADVVTGKLDVREAAARLPDEADEPETLAETEAESSADESDAGDLDEVSEESEA